MRFIQPYGGVPRLRSAIAAATLMAAAGTASAEPVSLTLEYTCPFPLIGEQPIQAQISADIPTEATVGEPLGPFQIDAITTVNEDSRLGLKLVGSETIEGDAISTNVIRTVTGDKEITVPLTVPQTSIPNESGAFPVPANGEAEAQLFTADQVGEGSILVGGLVLNLTARTADGSIAPAPIGQFTAECVQVAGQNNVLQTFEIAGDAPPPVAEISVEPESVDFGNVQAGLSVEQTLAVSNTGGAILGINGVSISGADAGAFMQTSDCTTVAAGESCAIDVTYFASDEGVQSATLTIESGDPENPTVDIPLTGNSVLVPVPEISVEPEQVSFGVVPVGASAERSVTVSNLGSEVLNINSLGIGGAGSGDFMQTSDCVTVAPEESCTVNLTFTASTAGARSGTLTIESDDPEVPSLEVSLSGTGDDGSSGSVDFLLDVVGSTVINASNSSLPLIGAIDADLELATGMFEADLTLEPTSGSFQVSRLFRKLNATAQVEFEQVGETTGTLINGRLTSDSRMYVKVPKVTVKFFGFNLPIGGGPDCRTMDPVDISLASPEGEQFAPLEGGNLTGTYDLPPLENCGGLTDILNLFLAGPGNTIDLALTPNLE